MANTEEKDTSKEGLTTREEEFCQLFVNGGKDFAGQRERCFKEVFGEEHRKNVSLCSRRLLVKPAVVSRVKELGETLQLETESLAIKLQITETLKAVMQEATTSSFSDRFDTPLSPAPLRAVAVNAAKALMELYPVKHVHESKLRIEGSDGNVIFNVVVPVTPTKDEDEEEG